MEKPPLTDDEVLKLLADMWSKVAGMSGATTHGDTALRSAERALVMLSASHAMIMDKHQDRSTKS